MTSKISQRKPDFDGPGMRARRARLIRGLRSRGIRDVRVLKAFADVPRHIFVGSDVQAVAYDDRPLPIGHGQTISQPYIVAVMLQALELGPKDQALEVGAGSGYATALLSKLAGAVYAIEWRADLVASAEVAFGKAGIGGVHLACGDGRLGWPEVAPLDAILVSAAAVEVPRVLLEQLAIGGRLVLPVGAQDRTQRLVRMRRVSEVDFEVEELCPVQFVPLLSGVATSER